MNCGILGFYNIKITLGNILITITKINYISLGVRFVQFYPSFYLPLYYRNQFLYYSIYPIFHTPQKFLVYLCPFYSFFSTFCTPPNPLKTTFLISNSTLSTPSETPLSLPHFYLLLLDKLKNLTLLIYPLKR